MDLTTTCRTMVQYLRMKLILAVTLFDWRVARGDVPQAPGDIKCSTSACISTSLLYHHTRHFYFALSFAILYHGLNVIYWVRPPWVLFLSWGRSTTCIRAQQPPEVWRDLTSSRWIDRRQNPLLLPRLMREALPSHKHRKATQIKAHATTFDKRGSSQCFLLPPITTGGGTYITPYGHHPWYRQTIIPHF